MTDRRQAEIPQTRMNLVAALRIATLIGGAALVAGATQAALAETVIKSHGISTFGDLQVPAGFRAFRLCEP